MLQWNDLHPYNVVHVVRIPAALDLERLKNVINGALQAHGLTGLTLERRKGTYHYAGGAVDYLKSKPSRPEKIRTLRSARKSNGN